MGIYNIIDRVNKWVYITLVDRVNRLSNECTIFMNATLKDNQNISI
jgi:hypothetical protein